MTPSQMRLRIGRLPAHTPLSDRFDREMRGGTAVIARAWYSSQKEHWRGWLKEYDGPGAYGRKSETGRDAAFVYNHVVNPQMLMWLAEAVEIPRSRLLAARRVALAAGGRMQEMSGAIRRVIPYEDLEPCLIEATTRRRN